MTDIYNCIEIIMISITNLSRLRIVPKIIVIILITTIMIIILITTIKIIIIIKMMISWTWRTSKRLQ